MPDPKSEPSIWDLAIQQGYVCMTGPRHNYTDCEHDYIFICPTSGDAMRFHGTLYDPKFEAKIRDYLGKHKPSP